MRKLFPMFVGGFGGVALLLVRLVVGLAFVMHGWPKIQNPMGWMNAMGGSSVPAFLQALAAFTEFGGGIALIVGLLTPIAAFGLICQMLGALLMVHLPMGHPFVSQGGPSYELALAYLASSLLLIALGPGRFSLDAFLFGGRETVRGSSRFEGGFSSALMLSVVRQTLKFVVDFAHSTPDDKLKFVGQWSSLKLEVKVSSSV